MLRILLRKLYLQRLIGRGLTVGKNFQLEKNCNIDANFPWLITIGNNVTLSSNVKIVAHDGASKKLTGYSGVGKVVLEDNVFVGINSVILCGVRIGKNSVIGANSCVAATIPENVVAAGNPAKVIMTVDEYREKIFEQMKRRPVYEAEYTIKGGVTPERKKKMAEELEIGRGFIV